MTLLSTKIYDINKTIVLESISYSNIVSTCAPLLYGALTFRLKNMLVYVMYMRISSTIDNIVNISFNELGSINYLTDIST